MNELLKIRCLSQKGHRGRCLGQRLALGSGRHRRLRLQRDFVTSRARGRHRVYDATGRDHCVGRRSGNGGRGQRGLLSQSATALGRLLLLLVIERIAIERVFLESFVLAAGLGVLGDVVVVNVLLRLTGALLNRYIAAGQVVDAASILLIVLEQTQNVGDLGLVVLLLLLEQEQLLLLLMLLVELLLLDEQLLLLLKNELLLLLVLVMLAGGVRRGQLALEGVDGRVEVEVLGRIGLFANIANGLEGGPHERVELETLLVEFDGLRNPIGFTVDSGEHLKHIGGVLGAILSNDLVVELRFGRASARRRSGAARGASSGGGAL